MKFYSDAAQKLYQDFLNPPRSLNIVNNSKREDPTGILPTEEAAPGDSISLAQMKRRDRRRQNLPDFNLDDLEILNTIKSHCLSESVVEGGDRPAILKPRVLNFSAMVDSRQNEEDELDMEDIVVEETLTRANAPRDSAIDNARKHIRFQRTGSIRFFVQRPAVPC